VGVIRTKRWKPAAGLPCEKLELATTQNGDHVEPSFEVYAGSLQNELGETVGQVFDVGLGEETRGIAQGLFSALRELDRREADVIFVDGIDDELDIAAAVMNRLRKAASETRA
jgi:L-threonylcarbamoyladenylate synthase